MVDEAKLFGLVLSGGRSQRYGTDKAAIKIDGQSLLERAVRMLRHEVDAVFVSVRADQTDDELRRSYALLIDEQPGWGPAGGILAAHDHDPSAAWLVLAVDLPFLDPDTLSALTKARQPGQGATACRSPVDGAPEPLCAIWEPATLRSFRQQAMNTGQLSPREMLLAADTCLLDVENAQALVNVNSPADWDGMKPDDHQG